MLMESRYHYEEIKIKITYHLQISRKCTITCWNFFYRFLLHRSKLAYDYIGSKMLTPIHF